MLRVRDKYHMQYANTACYTVPMAHHNFMNDWIKGEPGSNSQERALRMSILSTISGRNMAVETIIGSMIRLTTAEANRETEHVADLKESTMALNEAILDDYITAKAMHMPNANLARKDANNTKMQMIINSNDTMATRAPTFHIGRQSSKAAVEETHISEATVGALRRLREMEHLYPCFRDRHIAQLLREQASPALKAKMDGLKALQQSQLRALTDVPDDQIELAMLLRWFGRMRKHLKLPDLPAEKIWYEKIDKHGMAQVDECLL